MFTPRNKVLQGLGFTVFVFALVCFLTPVGYVYAEDDYSEADFGVVAESGISSFDSVEEPIVTSETTSDTESITHPTTAETAPEGRYFYDNGGSDWVDLGNIKPTDPTVADIFNTHPQNFRYVSPEVAADPRFQFAIEAAKVGEAPLPDNIPKPAIFGYKEDGLWGGDIGHSKYDPYKGKERDAVMRTLEQGLKSQE